MNYEDKYKSALEWMRSIYPTMQGAEREDAEHYFPELRESEDERIRKEIVDYLRKFIPHHDCDLVAKSKVWIAWLEKQKEFVSADFDDVWETADCEELTAPLDKYSKDAIKKMCHAWYDKGIELERRNWLEKQGKQMSDPRYSILAKLIETDYIYQMSVNDAMVEEAKNKAVEVLSKLEVSKLLGFEKQGEQILANSCKTCKDEQKPSWSEEDEKIYQSIIDDTVQENQLDGNQIAWLKSIKPNHWKPSKEQIMGMEIAINILTDKRFHIAANHLTSIYNDIKKL